MKKYFLIVTILAFIGLFFSNTADAQHRGRGYHHPPRRGYYHHPHHRPYPHREYRRGGYRHHNRATVRVNVPVPRPPRVIVRP